MQPQTETQPTELQIKQTVSLVKQKLANENIKKPHNRNIKEGYDEVLRILVEDVREYEGIGDLQTERGRAIAVLAIDYLLGLCTQKVLIGIPIK